MKQRKLTSAIPAIGTRMSLKDFHNLPAATTSRSKGKSSNKDPEHQEQVRYFQELERYPTLYEHAAAIPNGGHRHKATAGKLKAEGVKTGYPDILIDLPRGRYHGLRIEMKRPRVQGQKRGNSSDEQRDWMVRLSNAGYYCAYCEGWNEALQVTLEYANLGAFQQDHPTSLADRVSDWLRKRAYRPRK